MIDYDKLLADLLPSVLEAGDAIMQVYNAVPDVEEKSDGSPVTLADKRAEEILTTALKTYAPNITVISEENPQSHSQPAPDRFFLVDPLDGTSDFISRDGKGSFTVNIGLIENNVPTFGIVYAPAHKRMFYGIHGKGACEDNKPISTRKVAEQDRIAFTSLRHLDPQTTKWLADNQIGKTLAIGSSLKFGLLANGEADIYPRFGPTMEWDTAAGHAILLAAGGTMVNPDGSPFLYGKPNYKNGAFIASA